MNVQMLSNMRSVRRYSFLTLQIMRYVTCVILKVSTRMHHRVGPTWTYVLLQAVVGMAEGSLCYPNSKKHQMDIHRFDSPAALCYIKTHPKKLSFGMFPLSR